MRRRYSPIRIPHSAHSSPAQQSQIYQPSQFSPQSSHTISFPRLSASQVLLSILLANPIPPLSPFPPLSPSPPTRLYFRNSPPRPNPGYHHHPHRHPLPALSPPRPRHRPSSAGSGSSRPACGGRLGCRGRAG